MRDYKAIIDQLHNLSAVKAHILGKLTHVEGLLDLGSESPFYFFYEDNGILQRSLTEYLEESDAYPWRVDKTNGLYSYEVLATHYDAQCSFPNEGVQNDFEEGYEIDYFEAKLIQEYMSENEPAASPY